MQLPLGDTLPLQAGVPEAPDLYQQGLAKVGALKEMAAGLARGGGDLIGRITGVFDQAARQQKDQLTLARELQNSQVSPEIRQYGQELEDQLMTPEKVAEGFAGPQGAGGLAGVFAPPTNIATNALAHLPARVLLNPVELYKHHNLMSFPTGPTSNAVAQEFQLFKDPAEALDNLKWLGKQLGEETPGTIRYRGSAGDLPINPELLKAHPDTANTAIDLTVLKGVNSLHYGAAYNSPFDNITGSLGDTPEALNRLFEHELTHRYQNVAGWPRGGSPSWLSAELQKDPIQFSDLIKNAIAGYDKAGHTSIADGLRESYNDLLTDTSGGPAAKEVADKLGSFLYNITAGEGQARLSEDRSVLGAIGRSGLLSRYTYLGVPIPRGSMRYMSGQPVGKPQQMP